MKYIVHLSAACVDCSRPPCGAHCTEDPAVGAPLTHSCGDLELLVHNLATAASTLQ